MAKSAEHPGECWALYVTCRPYEIDEECRVVNNALYYLQELMEDGWEIVE
jgi:hypothetical protein